MSKNKSNIRIILITVFAVAAVILSVIAISGKAPQIRLSLAESGKVSDGILGGVPEGEHITSIPDGEIRYLINKNIFFESRYSKGNVMLENPSCSVYDLKFSIYLEDGTMIYSSPIIAPGQCLESDKLSAVMRSGEYQCAYSAKAFQNSVMQGEVSGVLTVTVG